MHGRSELIDVDYIECGIDAGLHYLDNARLRNIIHDLYRDKRTGKIIYIAATALCHLADRYGQTFLALLFALGNFELSNLYETARKFITTLLLGSVGPLVTVGDPSCLAWAFVLSTAGLRVLFIDLDSVATSPVYPMGSTENIDIKPRIPNSPDVIIVNNRNRNRELIMTNPVQKRVECWLPDQTFLNSNCKIKSTEIPNIINSVSSNLEYDKIVNMQDVTGLDRVIFTDKFDLGQINTDKLNLSQTKLGISNLRKGKMVNLLNKFNDSGEISKDETWHVSESPVLKKNLRTKN